MIDPQAIHDRSITTDTGWKILLGRGLDIFQRTTDGPLDLAANHQKYREINAFESHAFAIPKGESADNGRRLGGGAE